MNFTEATDRAMAIGVRLREIADAVGVSRAAIAAARLPEDSPSHREPPEGWETALRDLCERRSRELLGLSQRLSGK